MISEDDSCGRIDQVRQLYGIEGIPLLGGEPFLQAQGLSQAAEFAQSLGLIVLTFSGYRLEQLRGGRLPGTDGLLRYTGFLIDGPYLAESPDCGRSWVGSSNQRFWYFTDACDSSIPQSKRTRNTPESSNCASSRRRKPRIRPRLTR